MSRKRVKQYLMMLIVIGVVAVAASGGGTFASFSASTTNPNNTFANGTLLLHNTNGATTCTSESNSSNVNVGTGVGGDQCATLFSGVSLTPNATKLTSTATVTTDTSITLVTVGAPSIQPGDTLTLSDGSTTDTVTATSVGAPGSNVSINITWNTTNGTTYATSNTIVHRTSVTAYATLTLKNAGTVNGSSISYSGGSCSTHGTGSTASVTGASTGAGPYSIPVSGGIPTAIRSGQEIGLTQSGVTSYFTTAAAAAANATSVSVTTDPSAANGNTLVYGPEFGSTNICSDLEFVIIETTNTFGHATGDAALGCAAGTTAVTAANGCDFASSPNLNSISGTTALSLASGGGTGNTGSDLTASGSRYFVIGVKLPAVASANTIQGRTATFGLTWTLNQ